MNRNELISDISAKSEITKRQAETVLKTVLDVITVTIKQKWKIVINGPGTFTATARSARTGRNPQTGEAINIPATVVPGFKAAASSLKAVLNETGTEELFLER